MCINRLVFVVERSSVFRKVGTEIQNVCIPEIHVASHAHVASCRTLNAEVRVHSSANPC